MLRQTPLRHHPSIPDPFWKLLQACADPMDQTEQNLLALAAVLVLGTAAQWLAWRLRLPSFCCCAVVGREPSAGHLRARLLFSPHLTHRELTSRFEAGARIKATRLTDEFTYEDFQRTYGPSAVPLFLSEGKRLTVLTDQGAVLPKPGQTIIALVEAPEGTPQSSRVERSLQATVALRTCPTNCDKRARI
jgi:hypothetical protein